MSSVSSTGSERDAIRISRDVINSLKEPEIEVQLQVERSLDRLAQSQQAQAPGLVLNVCRQLISSSGEAIVVRQDDLFARLQPKYSTDQISGILDQLRASGMILSQDSQIKLSSGVLSKLIHAKVQAETAGQQKIEAFVANRYDYFLEKGQLLSEQDLNYIDPLLGDVVLSRERQEFIDASRSALKKEKRRGSLVLASVIALLSLLAIVAGYFAFTSGKQAKLAMENFDKAEVLRQNAENLTRQALEGQRLAREKEEEARIAEDAARVAEREALMSKLQLEEANKQIRQLLGDEKQARIFADEQKTKALESARKIDSLNAELNRNIVLATDEATKAKAARDTARQEKEISEELRNILLSRIVAQRSLALKEGDKDLKAYTAMLAYHINDSAKTGDVLHPDVFRAVYYAAKNQGSSAIASPTDLTNGAIGSIVCDLTTGCFSGASDGTVMQFKINQGNGAIQIDKRIFYLPHDAVHFVFPQKRTSGSAGTLFVLGAFDHILEVALPAQGSPEGTGLRRIPIPGQQFVKNAMRISDNELMIQSADGSLYAFDCTSGELRSHLTAQDDAVAWAALPHLGLLCYANAQNELFLTDMKRSTEVKYATAKKRVAQMQLKHYGTSIYLALGYVDGELEVFFSDKDAFLSAYQSQREGKSYYQIQSLRSSVHTGYIPEMVFAESRPLLAVCSYDRTVSVWDLQRWKERSGDYLPVILDDHDDWVTSCTFLPGDNAILTGSKLGMLKYWNLDPAKYVSGLCNGILRSPNAEEWREYIGDELEGFKEFVCRGK